MQIFWDWNTLFIYIFMAVVGAYCLSNNKHKIIVIKAIRIDFAWMIIFILWSGLAIFRCIDISGIGGTDAYGYVNYFQTCLDNNTSNIFSYRAEIGFRFFTRIIRFITDDYRVYLLIIYSVIISSYMFFLREFKDYNSSGVLYIVSFYYYLVTFCTIRSGLAAAIYLISITFLKKRKTVVAIILAILSVLIHSSMVFYVGFYVFWFIYRNRIPRIKEAIFWAFIGYCAGKIFQMLVVNNIISVNFGTPIDVYVSYSINNGFFKDYWKIVVSQLILMVVMIVCKKTNLKFYLQLTDIEAKKRFQFIYILCIYDLILVPLLGVLNVWRGIEYMFWPRLVMWGYIIQCLCKKSPQGECKFVKAIAFLFGCAYLVFRIYTQYDIGGLMPYIIKLQ